MIVDSVLAIRKGLTKEETTTTAAVIVDEAAEASGTTSE